MQILIAITVLLSLYGAADGCWIGTWHDWGSWSTCDVTCGGGQRSSRRTKCTAGIGSDDEEWQYESCNEFCNNGGYYSAGSCHCPSWREGRCCDDCSHIQNCHQGSVVCYSDGSICHSCVDTYYSGGKNGGCIQCPQIDHCVDRYCSTANDVRCRTCEHNYFFKLNADQTVCERLCAWNGHYCWPGTCTDGLTSGCTCASGFRRQSSTISTTCQPPNALPPVNISESIPYVTVFVVKSDNAPSVDTCEVIAVGPNGEKRRAPATADSMECQYKADFFGNYQLKTMQYDYSASFVVHNEYTEPSFIKESKFGITESGIYLQRKNVYGIDIGSAIMHYSIRGTSTTAETTDFQGDSFNVSENVANGERWCIRFEAKGGGYLISKDLTTQTDSPVTPYSTTVLPRSICYKFDSAAPTHCKENGVCSFDPMHVTQRITRSPSVTISFEGWSDPYPIGGDDSQASGIEQFDILVNEVLGTQMSSLPLKVSFKEITSTSVAMADNIKSISLSLNSSRPILYCLTLTVKDVADNVNHARRFVLYDNTSHIATRSEHAFDVSSASVDTHYTWQTHHNSVCLNWTGHFFNEVYFKHQLLNPIEPAPHGAIDTNSIYEQSSGILSVSGTSNVDGIIEYKLSWALDGGSISDEEPVPNFQSQYICKTFDLKDGQTYTMNIRAIDIASNAYAENRTVSIDQTVPHITPVGLIKDGYRRLYVHDSKDLSQMVLEFEALDPHSGVREVHWTFGTGEETLGNRAMSVIHQECANGSSNCYCPDVGLCEMYNYSISLNSLVADNKHRGDHNRNYYFTITVTNHARLSNTEHVDILVDESPPEPGVVFEGPEDSPDIDYMSDSSFLVHWHGFIDHESGIKLYRVGLADRCLDKQDLYNRDRSNGTIVINEVVGSESILRLPATFTGKRYLTVIAINNAMTPSIAVCSDGIIRDVSAPVIRNITIQHGRWSESIACHNDRAWLLSADLKKVLLHDTPSCQRACGGEHDTIAEVMPTLIHSDNDRDISDFMCNTLPRYTTDRILYIPNDNINIQWDIGQGLSQVRDFYVGFGSDPTETISPGLVDYVSTDMKRFFMKRHEGIGTDDIFYIFVKAVNKAGVNTVVAVGPVLIDETPPVIRQMPVVNLTRTDVVLGWNNDTFYDTEQTEPINHVMMHIDHGSGHASPVLEWRLDHSMPCPGYTGGCFTFPIMRLQRQDTDLGLEFHAVLYVYNNAGHYTHVTTPTFRVPSRYPPGHAVVLDIDPTDTDMSHDVNVHFTARTLCAKWTGFRHHEHVTLEVGIASSMFDDNIVTFHTINDTIAYCITNVPTTSGGKYYFSIRATCSGGQTLSSSNGVVIDNENDLMDSLTVFNGPNDIHQSVVLSNVDPISNAPNTFKFPRRLKIGQIYCLSITTKGTSVNLTDMNFSSIDAHVENVPMAKEEERRMFYMFPFEQIPTFSITIAAGSLSAEYIMGLNVCNNSTSYQSNIESLTSYWAMKIIDTSMLTFETSVAIARCDGMNSTCMQFILPFTKTKNNYSTTITGLSLRPDVVYKIAVRPCSGSRCLNYVLSGGVMVDNIPPSGHISQVDMRVGVKHTTCHSVSMYWHPFYSVSGISLYKWTLAGDDRGTRQLTAWRSIIPTADIKYNTLQVFECVYMSVHPHSPVFACVRAYNRAGLERTVCKRFKVTNDNVYDQHTVYDIDTSSHNWGEIKQLLHSALLGEKLSMLHESEMNVVGVTSDVAGVVLYANEREVYWYLMKSPHVPVHCSSDIKCVMSATSSIGYFEFHRSDIPHNTVCYICAYSTVTFVGRELFTERQGEINSCSNGFIIDTVPPGGGAVHVTNTNGYIVDTAGVEITWDGFSDNIDATELGYGSDIQKYIVYIGSRSGIDDLMPRTALDGPTSQMVVQNASFKDGTSVFATVAAFDHAGNNATVVSHELMVDTTPPSVGRIHVQSDLGTGRYVGSGTVYLYITGVHDPESGIRDFRIGVGSLADRVDVMPLTVYTTDHVELRTDSVELHDGHTYFINAVARNRADLSSDVISTPFILDRSAPTGGHVIDGGGRTGKHVDYQTDISHIHSSWRGFSDPHSGILYYRAALGTQPHRDDVQANVDVGLSTEIVWNCTFTPGTRYYTTVDACNWAGLCKKRTSDGIVLDNSPPTAGIVRVTGNDHQKYIPHSTSVHVEWVGFTDPQSGLDHFDVCLGTAPLVCDLQPWFNCLLSSSTIKTGLHLHNNTDLYATVKATNKARLHVLQVSDSFRVDVSPPVLVTQPAFLPDYNSVNGYPAQWERSVLRMFWKFRDDDSPIVRHIVTLLTHHEGHTPIEHIDIGAESKLTINLNSTSWLHNGDRYRVSVTACNAAGMCSTAVSEDLLIDATPPHLGGLKPPMTWHNWREDTGNVAATVNVSWYGFLDQESGVRQYFITISRTYSGQELSNGTLSVMAGGNTGSFNLTDAILPDDKLVISIWAENVAGLKSSIARVTVDAISTTVASLDVTKAKGILEIQKHSCDAHYCNKDCTCAVVGKPCVDIRVSIRCIELTASDVFTQALPTVDVFGGMPGRQQNITASSACLAGYWRPNTNATSANVERFEWSIGIRDQPFGEGVFDLKTEMPWNDVGLRTSVIHCLPLGRSLLHNLQYVVYVRAWYGPSQYAVFRSAPITVDRTAPAIRRGGHVKDSDSTCVVDYDYVDWTDTITVCWDKVFRETQSRIHYYTVALGASTNSDDVYPLTDVGLHTSHTVTNVSLSPGTRYYFTVTAVNSVGLHTSVGSDGFVVDTDAPLPGVVFTTTRHRDVSVQSSNTTLSLSWHGFVDHYSGIRSYHAAVVEARDTRNRTPLKSYRNVGLQNKVTFTNLNLQPGATYHGAVYAVDAAGHVSNTSMSRGVLIDVTPPAGFTCRNFSTVSGHVTWNTTDGGYSGTVTHSFVKNRLYKLSGEIKTGYPEVHVRFEFARFSLMLPMAVNHDGTRVFEYNIISPVTGEHDVILDIETSANATMTATLRECISMDYITGNAIESQQISESRVAVNVQVVDLESSVYNVLVGAGTTPGGFQVRALSPVRGGNNGVIPAALPHGSPLYVTAIAENHAGLRATFHGGPIIMDHTPPGIEDLRAHVEYDNDMTSNVTSPVQIVATWTVTEPESGINSCFCNLVGVTSRDADDTPTLSNGTVCTIPVPAARHGQELYITVTCINTVQLATKVTSRPVVISSRKPTSENARVEFIPTDTSSFVTDAGAWSTTPVQANSTCVHLAWAGFSDPSGLHHYEYRLLTDNRTLVDWTSTNMRTHILVSGLNIKDGAEITGNLRAVNRGSYHSDTMATAIIVDGREPKISGDSAMINILHKNIHLDWRAVFLTHDNIPATYSLAVGSMSGYADLADVVFTTAETHDVALPEYSILTPEITTVYVVVTCRYATGMYAIYRTHVDV